MPRIKPVEAMEHLGLKRDSFLNWCDAVNLKAHEYEFSNRTYYISGEFYAKADYKEIMEMKELHGDMWHKFYPKSAEVIGYLSDSPKPKINQGAGYIPKSKAVSDFIKKLKNEKS